MITLASPPFFFSFHASVLADTCCHLKNLFNRPSFCHPLIPENQLVSERVTSELAAYAETILSIIKFMLIYLGTPKKKANSFSFESLDPHIYKKFQESTKIRSTNLFGTLFLLLLSFNHLVYTFSTSVSS